MYQDVFPVWELENIDYLVLMYLDTGASPFEECAEDSLHEGED
jgi:hypothetical protein